MMDELDRVVADLNAKRREKAPPEDWRPVDLGPILAGETVDESPSILRRTDDVGLLYPGKLHALYAEPEGVKTWLALAACHEQIQLGRAGAVPGLRGLGGRRHRATALSRLHRRADRPVVRLHPARVAGHACGRLRAAGDRRHAGDLGRRHRGHDAPRAGDRGQLRRGAVRRAPAEAARPDGRGRVDARPRHQGPERTWSLTGVGGIGKTRLAIDLVTQAGHESGPLFVDLAGINDVELVPAALAAALGIQVQPYED